MSRQKRFTFDGEHFFIEFVFYNYILKCFVLIDLKTGKLTQQDLADVCKLLSREMMNEGDNLPIGIVLCADKSESIALHCQRIIARFLLPNINFTCHQRKNCSGNIMY